MKIQVKTFNQKTLVIEIDGSKTVYDLKQQLALYPDIGVQPELQRVIYAGKVLADDGTLESHGINLKKFVVVKLLSEPEERPSTSQASFVNTTGGSNTSSATDKEKDNTGLFGASSSSEEVELPSKPTTSLASGTTSKQKQHEDMVENIVGMGYQESEVRRALEASFYTPERAIEYLIEGIPTPTAERAQYTQTDPDGSISPRTLFRTDPFVQELRQNVNQDPDIMIAALDRIKEANPQLLTVIDENQDEFFRVLGEQSDEECVDAK